MAAGEQLTIQAVTTGTGLIDKLQQAAGSTAEAAV
jgi:hypothetical protein